MSVPARVRPRLVLALAAALLSAVACGGSADDADDTLAAAEGDTASVAAPADAPAPTADLDAPLTVDDIDRWQRGMAAELEAVREAGAQLARATTGEDSVSAIFAANDMSTRAAGARGAGLDEDRYARVASRLSDVVGYMVPLSAVMDVSAMPAEMQQQMQAGRDQSLARAIEELPAEVVEALRPRAEALRQQEMELVGERLKAAGMAR